MHCHSDDSIHVLDCGSDSQGLSPSLVSVTCHELEHGLCSHSRKEFVGNFKNCKGERFGLLVNYPIKNS